MYLSLPGNLIDDDLISILIKQRYLLVIKLNCDRYVDITKAPSALCGTPALQHYKNVMWGLSIVPGLIIMLNT